MAVNTVTLAGNLTAEPELRQTPTGVYVVKFSIAVNERKHNRATDEWEDRPSFFDCVMYGKRAESVSRFLGRGSKVSIQGKLRQDRWEFQGQNRSKVIVIVDEIELMSKQAQPAAAYQATNTPNDYSPADMYDEDVPF